MPYRRAALGDTADGQWVRMEDERGGEMAMDLCRWVGPRRKAAGKPGVGTKPKREFTGIHIIIIKTFLTNNKIY
jgi:hypothetical protein